MRNSILYNKKILGAEWCYASCAAYDYVMSTYNLCSKNSKYISLLSKKYKSNMGVFYYSCYNMVFVIVTNLFKYHQRSHTTMFIDNSKFPFSIILIDIKSNLTLVLRKI